MSTDVQPPGADEVAAQTAAGAAPDVIADSFGEYVKIWWTRVRNGESGALPVILGLVVIVVYFQARSSLFLSAGNLVNLIEQAAWIVTLGMAEVFVLLLGEIDLSIGYTSAIGAVFTCWLLVPPDPAPWPLAVLVGLAFPALFGLVEGVIITSAPAAVLRGHAGRPAGRARHPAVHHQHGRARLGRDQTTRNRVLETIREMLETLAGPVQAGEGLSLAVQSLRRGLQAEEVALITQPAGSRRPWRAYAGPARHRPRLGRASLRGDGRGRAVQRAS